MSVRSSELISKGRSKQESLHAAGRCIQLSNFLIANAQHRFRRYPQKVEIGMLDGCALVSVVAHFCGDPPPLFASR